MFNVFSRLPSAYAASRTQGQKFLKRAGRLSIVEWRTLWDLHEGGAMTIRELAEIQHADHSLVSRALPKMLEKGYVKMARDGQDGRQTIVELAEAGRLAYERAAPIMKERRKALREWFSQQEIQAFVDFLDRFEEFTRLPVEELISEDAE
jgi:DNA-binding MarR family transcriptional regulator